MGRDYQYVNLPSRKPHQQQVLPTNKAAFAPLCGLSHVVIFNNLNNGAPTLYLNTSWCALSVMHLLWVLSGVVMIH